MKLLEQMYINNCNALHSGPMAPLQINLLTYYEKTFGLDGIRAWYVHNRQQDHNLTNEPLVRPANSYIAGQRQRTVTPILACP